MILNDGETGDYINASHITMDIPGSGIVNRYIATQGPLASTTSDFWQMVWEQQTPLIVMVTPLVERGSIKCHKYWPEPGEAVHYGNVTVKCTKQLETAAMVEREFALTYRYPAHDQDQENRSCKSDTSCGSSTRLVAHLQYTSWPDHGVPDDPHDFLDLVFRVRRYREGSVEPVIVHCSAGIGRTGVLIMMETAMCCIEANEPIYPLELLKTMREQRGGLIQTLSQFKFVCSAIIKIYIEKIITPLEEYNARLNSSTKSIT